MGSTSDTFSRERIYREPDDNAYDEEESRRETYEL